MRISDWSSDVCSSDLVRRPAVAGALHAAGPLALDQPHVRPGILVLADPAGVRRAFAGHRLRRQDASAGHDEHARQGDGLAARRSEEHTSELQSLMRISYAVFCLKKKTSRYRNKLINEE